jgi:dipeptidyl aminopeptidase/acylaminoacyl peptidase
VRRVAVLLGLLMVLMAPAAASGGKAYLDCACFSYFRISPDGTHAAQVSGSRGDLQDVSADGLKILYQYQVGTLWFSPLATTTAQHVAGTLDAGVGTGRLSPGAMHVAYLARSVDPACGTPSIHVVGVDGTDDRTVLAGCAQSVAWSPDGSRIAYVRGQFAGRGPSELHVLELASGADRMLAQRQGLITGVAWAPLAKRPAYGADAGRIAYSILTSTYGSLHVVRTDGTGDLAVSHGYAPVWSPDGQRLAYLWVSPPVGKARVGRTRLAVIAKDGSLNHVLDKREYEGFSSTFAWSPDSRKLVYAAYEPDNETLFTINRDGTGRRRLVTGDFQEEFGPIRWRPGVIRYTSIVNWED